MTKDERKQCAAKLLAKVFHTEEALRVRLLQFSNDAFSS